METRIEAKPSVPNDPAKANWTPEWTVDVGQGCTVGLAVDDGCFVALLENEVGQWRPMKWWPPAVARKAAEVAQSLQGGS